MQVFITINLGTSFAHIIVDDRLNGSPSGAGAKANPPDRPTSAVSLDDVLLKLGSGVEPTSG